MIGVAFIDLEPETLDEFTLARLPNVCPGHDLVDFRALEVINLEAHAVVV